MRSWTGLLLALGLSGLPLLQGASLTQQTCVVGSCLSTYTSGLLDFPKSSATYTADAQAWAQYDSLRAYATVTGINDPGADQVVATASAVDRLFLSGSGTVQFLYDVSGSITFALDSGREEVYVDAGPNSNLLTHYLLFRQSAGSVGGIFPYKPLQTQLTLTFDYDGFLDYTIGFTALAYCYTSEFQSHCNGSGTVDFLHTMQLAQISVFDANGSPVSSPVITSQSGFNYSQFLTDTSTTPEPSTWVLFLFAASSLALLRRLFQSTL